MSSVARHVGGEYKSPLGQYLVRLGRIYDQIVVQSTEEFARQLEDLSFEHSLDVSTLILPEGVGLSDPRLKHARVKSADLYMLKLGEKFRAPRPCYIADLHASLIPPALGPFRNEETRYQVLGPSEISGAVQAASQTGRRSFKYEEGPTVTIEKTPPPGPRAGPPQQPERSALYRCCRNLCGPDMASRWC